MSPFKICICHQFQSHMTENLQMLNYWRTTETILLYVIYFLWLSRRKTSIPLLWDKMHYHPEKWFNHHQTNFLSMEWEKYPVFQCTHTCIDCWDNDCHLTWSFKWHAIPYHLGNWFVFLRHLFFCFVWISPDKSSILNNADYWFTEYNFHPIIHTRHDCFILVHFNHIFFCWCVNADFLLAFLLCIIPFNYVYPI